MGHYLGRKEAKDAFYYGEFGTVVDCVNFYLEPSSLDHESFFMRGTCLFFTDDYKMALEDLNRAIELCDKCPDYFYQRYLINNKLKNNELATEDIERACSFDEAKPQFFYILATNQYNRKDYNSAQVSVAIAIRQGFSNGDVQQLKGLIHCKLEEFEEAIESMKKVIGTKFPAGESTYSTMGYCYYKLGLNEMEQGFINVAINGASISRLYGELLLEGIGCLRVAISLNPENASNYFYRGMAYKYIGNYEGAMEDLSAAIRLEPTEEVFYEQWASISSL